MMKYVWDRDNLAAEVSGSTIVNMYDYGQDGITSKETSNGDKTLYLKNAHGDVVGMTDTSGNVSANYQYDAFGNTMSETSPDPFGYCGEYLDSESGLIYLRNRYYDSSTGRFITEDPVKDGLNWYNYCAGNPILNVDPNGLTWSNYNKYKNTFTSDDFELSWEAQLKLADYKNNYANGEHRVSHKKANLLRSLDHAFQEHFGWKYTVATKAPTTMEKIDNLSIAIAETSSSYNVPKAVISAILAREITCYIPGEDVIGASVGVAQINPETVLSSFREYYNSEYGFTAKQIEKALKNDDSFSVNMCGLIIANIARQQGVDLYNCSRDELESVISGYNGYGESAAQYGRETYVYYEAYNVYYNT